MRTKLRAYGSAVVVVLLFALLMIWTGGWVWLHLDRLWHDFSIVQSESFHLAEHVEERILGIRATLRSLDVHQDPVGMADFRRQTGEMKAWVQTNQPSVTSIQQREALVRTAASFDIYVAKANRILEENLHLGSNSKPRLALDETEEDALRVLGSARELRGAEQAALARFVRDSRRATANLYGHVLVSVALAFLLGVAALRLIHVARIAPLQAELVHSHSILEQKEKLAALGTLAAGVAHEVRNPLTAIKVRLHGLKRLLEGNSSANDDFDVINHEIKRLERIVGDFLQFARPSAPKMETFAVVTLFHQLDLLFGPQVRAAGLEWNVQVAPEILARADQQQIEQVLINLIHNAIENTERGGSVTLRADTCQSRWSSGTAPGILLEIADTGRGITPAVEKRLFDPFFSTKEAGTGLGLSIAALIIEKHGGQLRYRTKVGCGTTFCVILPSVEGTKHAS